MALGVRSKLVLLAAFILVGVSFGFLGLNLWLAGRWVDEDVQARAITFSQVLAASISSRQEFESGTALQRQALRIRATREDVQQLDLVALFPTGSTVVASTAPESPLPITAAEALEVGQGRVVSRPGPGGRDRDVLAPVSLDGAVVGAVVTRFSSGLGDRLAGRIRTGGLLLTGASVLVMGLLMSLAVRHVVDRPVQELLGAIDRHRRGQSDATAAVTGEDELGVLARHFNELMARVRRFNDELQGRVREATGQLAHRYREVQQLEAVRFDLQRRLAQAERLAVSGRIMAEVAHEVGTPLHSLMGHLELLRRDLPADELAGERTRRLAIVEAQVARVIEIITRLLDLTRPPARETRAVDLNALVGEVAELVGPALAAAGLRLELRLAPDLPPVDGHADQLQQVTLNLLTNAMDATPAGGRVAVTTRAAPEPREVELTVSDTGPGIPAEDRDRIFEPFFTTKPAGRGTGLGLFVTAQIVRDHKGHIEVSGVEGQGCRFRVRLPALARAA